MPAMAGILACGRRSAHRLEHDCELLQRGFDGYPNGLFADPRDRAPEILHPVKRGKAVVLRHLLQLARAEQELDGLPARAGVEDLEDAGQEPCVSAVRLGGASAIERAG